MDVCTYSLVSTEELLPSQRLQGNCNPSHWIPWDTLRSEESSTHYFSFYSSLGFKSSTLLVSQLDICSWLKLAKLFVIFLVIFIDDSLALIIITIFLLTLFVWWHQNTFKYRHTSNILYQSRFLNSLKPTNVRLSHAPEFNWSVKLSS